MSSVGLFIYFGNILSVVGSKCKSIGPDTFCLHSKSTVDDCDCAIFQHSSEILKLFCTCLLDFNEFLHVFTYDSFTGCQTNKHTHPSSLNKMAFWNNNGVHSYVVKTDCFSKTNIHLKKIQFTFHLL